MRTLLLCSLLLAPLLSGCADEGDPTTADLPAVDQPMAAEVVHADADFGRCNNLYRDQDILVVRVRLTNLAAADVGPSEYDVAGLDEDGEEYPMCWPDEPVVPAGDSVEVDFRFYVTSEDCDVLDQVVVRQLRGGAWVASHADTGIKDPC